MLNGILLALAAAAALFLTVLVAPLTGAFAGAVVGYLFPATVSQLTVALGLSGFAPWQLGFSLGLVGSFFRAYKG